MDCVWGCLQRLAFRKWVRSPPGIHRGMGRWISSTRKLSLLGCYRSFFYCWEGTYAGFPLGLPQDLDRPLVRVDSVELVSENPVHHIERTVDGID